MNRHIKTLPSQLLGILDFEYLSERTGVDASCLRRTAASFVRFLLSEALPYQPRATLSFLHELEGLVLEQRLSTDATAAIVAEFRRLAHAQGLRLPDESRTPTAGWSRG